MSSAVAIYDQPQIQQPKSLAAIGAERTAIRQLMKEHMKDGVHFMTIPGTPKPSLTKPGSELILSMFHIAAEPIVDDLSTPDEMRYRVFVQLTEMGSGRILGKGVGEASSAETKYQWRAMVCQQEFDETPADRRRVIYKKGYQGNAPTRVFQVRTEMSDVANTILKMAKKRAQIDATLTVTAASDLFMQDAEEVIAAGLDMAEEAPAPVERPATLQPKQQPSQQSPGPQTTASGVKDYGFGAQQPAPVPQQATPRPAATGVRTISEAQGRLLYARGKAAGKTYSDIDAYLAGLGYTDKAQIPAIEFNGILEWASAQ